LIGRLVTSLITDFVGWRWALGVIGVLGLAATIIFWRLLAPSRHFVARPANPRSLARTFATLQRDPNLLPLFALGFLYMGAFITTYNYITYHLIDPPYSLPHRIVGFIFVVYIVGIFSSAFIGSRADRVGRLRMVRGMALVMLVGVVLMAFRPLPVVILGLATVTFGFFGGHSVASSWIGLRAKTAKGQASALYRFWYYIGASVAGSIGGIMWDHWRWPGVELFIAAMLVLALTVALTTLAPDQPSHATH
jgi:YNFM family putative membrane transporter